MNICTDHWEKLKQAIKDRGLWQLVSKDGEEATQCLTQDIESGIAGKKMDPDYYDPLLSATWMIYTEALRRGGLYLMQEKYCPLCEVKKHLSMPEQDADAEWINSCCDSIKQYCEEEKLV